jgi:putative endonuclease
MKHNQKIGKWGEDIAAQYLVEKGYAILFRNWKSSYGELDLIVKKEEVISIVEVKTRTGKEFGWPEESITPLKQEHLFNASQDFFDEHTEFTSNPWQIDVIAILIESQVNHQYQIKHYENAVANL